MSLDLNVTEGDPFVEVCVEIVVGTVSEEGTVAVETISGTATGKLDYDVQQSLIMGVKMVLRNMPPDPLACTLECIVWECMLCN